MSDKINTYTVPDCNMSYDENDVCPNGTSHTHPPCNPTVVEGQPYYDCTPIMAYHEYASIITDFEKYCDWDTVSSHPLHIEFIKKYAEHINWEKLLQVKPFTEAELIMFRKHIPVEVWQKILPKHQHLSEEFIFDYRYLLDWVAISRYQKLSNGFIRKMSDYVDWINISRYQELNEETIMEFENRVSWLYISMYQKLSEDFIRKYADRVNWMSICEYQNISEAFIIEFTDKVDWKTISKHKTLSESFILTNLDKLYLVYVVGKRHQLTVDTIDAILAHPKCDGGVIDAIIMNQNIDSSYIEDSIIPRFTDVYNAWVWISIFPRLTEEFINTYADKLSWEHISRCQTLSETFISEHEDLVHWDEIFKHQNLTPEFILRYKDKT